VEYSPCPYFDLEEEYFIQQTVKKAIRAKLLQSAHDLSDGGLFAALLESAMPRGLGFEVASDAHIRKDAWLFGEAQSRILVTVQPEQSAALERFLNEKNAPFSALGTVTGDSLSVDGENWGKLAAWKRTYETVLGETMEEG
jgi:phosphoribosylformylglycinamidine synthase subunit PurL